MDLLMMVLIQLLHCYLTDTPGPKNALQHMGLALTCTMESMCQMLSKVLSGMEVSMDALVLGGWGSGEVVTTCVVQW